MNLTIPIYDVLQVVKSHWSISMQRSSIVGLTSMDTQHGLAILELHVTAAVNAEAEYNTLRTKLTVSGQQLLPLRTGNSQRRAIKLDRRARNYALMLMRKLVHRNHPDLVMLRKQEIP